MDKLAHPLLFLAIATFPLYLLPSGGAQVSHVFFVFFLAAFASPLLTYFQQLSLPLRRALKIAATFTALVILIQLAAATYYGDADFITFAVFYLFNLVYLWSVVIYLRARPRQGIYWVYAGVVAAIVVAAIGVPFGSAGGGGRNAGFFNNPNQLGYFGVVSMALLLTMHARQTGWKLRWFTLGMMSLAFLLCVISLSKAAMIASAISVLMFLPTFKRSQLAAIVLGGVLLSPFLYDKLLESDQYQLAMIRLQSIGQEHDDNLSARGYSRIANFPQYLMTGAGEGRFTRFGSTFEIHSTIANVLFSYGILGFSLFVMLWIRVYRLSPSLFVLVFTGVFLYGLTHNGIRSSYFWLLVAVFIAVADQTPIWQTMKNQLHQMRGRVRPSGRSQRQLQWDRS